MEKHIQIIINRLSFASITIATLTLLLLYLQTSETCFAQSNPNPKPHTRFPDPPATSLTDPTPPLTNATAAFGPPTPGKTSLPPTPPSSVPKSHHKHLPCTGCVSWSRTSSSSTQVMGMEDVIGVELVESPPLVSRADPHNLPFFDAGVFDLVVGLFLDRAFFSGKVYLKDGEDFEEWWDLCGDCGADEIVRLLKKSEFVDAKNVSFLKEKMTRIVMRVRG